MPCPFCSASSARRDCRTCAYPGIVKRTNRPENPGAHAPAPFPQSTTFPPCSPESPPHTPSGGDPCAACVPLPIEESAPSSAAAPPCDSAPRDVQTENVPASLPRVSLEYPGAVRRQCRSTSPPARPQPAQTVSSATAPFDDGVHPPMPAGPARAKPARLSCFAPCDTDRALSPANRPEPARAAPSAAHCRRASSSHQVPT